MKKENEMALQWAQMGMIRWVCDVEVTYRFECNELRDRTGTDNIVTMVQRNKLRWYGHVSRKE